MTMPEARGDDAPPGPRAAAWKAVDTAIEEGKPKTAIEALRGVEQAAVADRAWAEAARAIATRILAETGDRPGDDPERLILLAGAMDKAPPETRGVLEAIRANWTWGFFQMNRWRFQQRTTGGSKSNERADDLKTIAEWDLPTIVSEIRKRFAVAVGDPDSPDRKTLQSLPVAEWSAIITKGKLSDAYRPTVWDVIVRDALEFASSGERGLVAPEDAFELDASGPALGTLDETVMALGASGVGAGALLVFILALGYYITPALLGGSTDQMISYFVADNMGRSLNWGLASALAAILLGAVLVLYAIYDRIAGPGNLKLG